MNTRFYMTAISVVAVALLAWAYAPIDSVISEDADADEYTGDIAITLPHQFQVEKLVDGLTFPTGLAWDDQERLYVMEAGGGLEVEQKAPSRILRVDVANGAASTTELVDLTDKGVFASVVGLAWHDGAFFITHRDPGDFTGAVSRVTLGGDVTRVLSGIIDGQSEHQINDIRVGPDGRLYTAVGPSGNSGVVDPSIAPWVKASPDLRTTACEDLVLLGKNFKMPNFLTEEEGDSVLTGAFVPFGTETSPGQEISAVEKCGGSILAFNPNDAEATVQVHAWGFRNLIGVAWNSQTGAMYAAENGYDVRGARPVNDEVDVSLRIEEGVWYGVPDFSAGREPLTDPKFESPDSLQSMVFIGGEPQGKDLGFIIDHAASGLTAPDPSLVVGRHEINASPSLLDVAPQAWGDLAGHLFVAEWGDLSPPTNPLRGKKPSGFQVVQVNPETGEVQPFLRNLLPGPASAQGRKGDGIEHPFNVRFGPDSAMYVVDYGVVSIDTTLTPPYRYEQGTGSIWKVSLAEATAVEKVGEVLPGQFSLAQNYPNPFNPVTRIRFALAEQVPVTLRVYDSAGREVARLVDQRMGPGSFRAQWNATDRRGQAVASGVYFYKLDAGPFSQSKQMTLVK